ncbi:MAG: glycosyltransferase [Actinobacteria bacterium]|nr:glycosyltransferase [Actinomycetota bacterium]
MKKIIFISEQQDACSWYRAHVPGVELQKRGYEVALVIRRDWALCDAADVIVFEKTSSGSALEDLVRYKEAGKLIAYDIDDNIWNLNPANPAYPYYSVETTRNNLAASLRMADVVTVTTPQLADAVSKFNRNVRIIPNCLPDENWNVGFEDDGVLTVGWAGSITHWEDLKTISNIIEQTLDGFPQVEFAVAGMASYPFSNHQRIRKLEAVKLEEYPKLLSKFDIALAPLTDDSFNACKSDLKFLEYAALGLPVIASKVAAYESSVDHGRNGFLARNPKDWLKYLRRLINDEGLREEIGAAARKFAESRFMSGNIGLWESALDLDRSQTEAAGSNNALSTTN